MDPVTIAMAVAALAPMVGDLIGRALAAGDIEEAKRLSAQAVAEYNIPIPSIEAMAARVGPSAMGGVRADPELQGAQRAALAQLMTQAQEGPNNIEYRAAMDQATRDVSQQANARDVALQQEMQARGMGNSGQAMVQRQMASQAASNRMAGAGFDAALGGRRAALQSLQAGAGLAGQMEERDLGLQSARARASDEIERFNETNRAGAVRDRFGMQTGLADRRAGALNSQAATLRGQGQQTQQQWGNYGQAGGQVAGAFGQYALDERRRKEDRDYWRGFGG